MLSHQLIALVISGFAIVVSIVSVCFSIFSWRQANRPIVAAKLRTVGSGNIATVLELVVFNTGNRPACDVQLGCLREDLKRVMTDNVDGPLRDQILACFSPNSMIPLLENDSRASCAFGVISQGSNSTWKVRSRLPITLTYRDLSNRRYKESVTLLIAGEESFSGFEWVKGGLGEKSS